MESTNDQVLDAEAWGAIVDLWSDEKPSALVELLDTFLKDATGRVAEIQAALASGQSDRVEWAAHALKSSCANLGAARLSGLCRRMEHLARDQAMGDAAQAMPALQEAMDATRDALLQERARQEARPSD
jgi:HPt (histidine-containing phosphotransfer) domain-containing protein